MKKVFKSIVVFLCLLFVFNLFTPSVTSATESKKDLIDIVRIVENGKRFIIILLNNIQISKMEEL